jgi:hypothetical protein
VSSPLLPRHEDGLSRMDSIQQLLKRIHVPTLAFGVILGILSIQLLVGRPLMQRLSGLSQNVADINQQLLLLTGHRDDVNSSNSLLDSLRTQHDLLVDARKSVDEIRTLQQSIQREARQTSEALAAIRDFAGLQSELISRREEFNSASESFDVLVSLETRVDELAGKTADRIKAINESEAGYDKALASLDKLAGVKNQAIASVDKIADAEKSIATLVTLRQNVAAQQADLDGAQKTLDQLITVKSTIVEQKNVAAAQDAANGLIALKDQIAANQESIPAAKQNLDNLVNIENQLAGRTPSLADAIQNLELMTGLQEEFNVQTGKLESLRRSLTEIVMMETALSRTLQLLEPITTRANLRRLDDSEIREVARKVLDRRQPTTQMADNKSKDGFEPGRSEILVPNPVHPLQK